MGTVIVKRPPRRPAPALPTGELLIEAPPEVPPPAAGRWQQLLMLLPMLAGAVAMAMMFGQGGGAYSYVIGGLFGVSALATLITSLGSAGTARRAEIAAARRDYLRYLAELRQRVRETVTEQRIGLFYRHPHPAQLWSTVDSYRLWERRAADPDFCVVRVGVGPQPLATPLTPATGRSAAEPVTAEALRGFLDTYTMVPDLPVAVSLRRFSQIVLRHAAAATGDAGDSTESGGRAAVRALARAMLAQLAVFHAPNDLLIAICAGPDRRAAWDWVKWLPHAQHPAKADALGPARLVADSGRDLERLLADILGGRPRFSLADPPPNGPHLVVVLDGGDLTGTRQLTTDGGISGVTLLDLDGRPPQPSDRAALLLEVDGGRLTTVSGDGPVEVGRPDRLDPADAEAVARRLAPLRLAAAAEHPEPNPTDLGLAELLGLGDPENYRVAHGWAPRAERDRLRVPIGMGVDGAPVELDLKESAQGGMGPHGLVVGATGSGKSELLRTLVLGLAATHSSESLNFVLVDFKGGATFASLDRLPHIAALITNLTDHLPLVDRMVDAVNGELIRRQELLRQSGNYTSARDYERARAGGAPLPPLPSLLIICDEFSELLAAKPDFIDVFVQIGRVGRSLGVHLLLATQRLEEGRLRGLDTHLSYRIGLRTFSSLESRTVLGVPDAYTLPSAPGHGYLRVGTEPPVRFKAAYVSGVYQRTSPTGGATGDTRVLHYTVDFVPPVEPVEPTARSAAAPTDGPTLLDILVDRMVGEGPPAHQVWLPPLGAPPRLDELLGPIAADPRRGLAVVNPELHAALRVPVAIIDKPFEQRRDPLWLALDGAAGHVAIAGAPQSGKSTLLRTLICALALTHTPAEVQIYCLDFGGGALTALRGLPHVGGVAGRLDAELVRRTVGEIAAVLTERERRFVELGIDSVAAYRKRRAAGGDPDPFGDVFLVVDGWSTLRGEYDDLEPTITDIATRGLAYGVHVVVTTTRWMELRPAIRDLFGSKVELRLGDPTESTAPRRAAANVPERAPGRGITSDGFHFLTALPELADADPPGLVKAVAAEWSGPPAPRVRLLPPVLPYGDLDLTRADGLRLPVGIAEADLSPVNVDFAADPHLLVFGDAECGKTSFLRALARSITTRFAPVEARLIIIDYRRGLLGAVDTEHQIGYCTTAVSAGELLDSVAGYMQRRLPGPDVTPQQLRERSWWQGPELFLLVDDYDLVAAGPDNPVQRLAEYLPHARDIGLHLVLARRAAGAARSLYEPVMQRLRDLSSPALIMSGEPGEGPLIGNVRLTPLPPGRGRLVTRRDGERLIQLAYLPEV
ncbi:MAG TPA: type VII secretion protein EccCa [Micromonosporaceae bacterium]